MTWDAEDEQDISDLPLRVRWRYRLRPAALRYLINRVWPGRWSAVEIAQIERRAKERAAALRDLAD